MLTGADANSVGSCQLQGDIASQQERRDVQLFLSHMLMELTATKRDRRDATGRHPVGIEATVGNAENRFVAELTDNV